MTDLRVPGVQEPKPKEPQDPTTEQLRANLRKTLSESMQDPPVRVRDDELPPNAKDNLLRLLRSKAAEFMVPVVDDRGRVLVEPVLDEGEAWSKAVAFLPEYLDREGGEDAVKDYIKGGRTPAGFLMREFLGMAGEPRPIPLAKRKAQAEAFRSLDRERGGVLASVTGPPEPVEEPEPTAIELAQKITGNWGGIRVSSIETLKGQQVARKFRETSPKAAAFQDYFLNPLGEIAGTLAQVGTNIVYGAAQLTRLTEKETPDIVRAIGGSYADTLYAMRETASREAQILGGAGSLIGMAIGFAPAPAAGAAGVFGTTVGKGGALARALLTPSTILKPAQKLGEVAGKISRIPGGAQIGHAAATFGAYEALAAKPGERGEALLRGTVAGTAFGTLGKIVSLGLRGMFKSSINSLGQDEKAAMEALRNWARSKKVLPENHELKNLSLYDKRVVDTWIAAGLPGAKGVPVSKRLMAYALKGGSDAIGFTLLDGEVWKELLPAIWDGITGKVDSDVALAAAGKLIDKMASNLLGAGILHAGGLSSVVPWQRRLDIKPTGKEPRLEPLPELPPKPPPPPSPEPFSGTPRPLDRQTSQAVFEGEGGIVLMDPVTPDLARHGWKATEAPPAAPEAPAPSGKPAKGRKGQKAPKGAPPEAVAPQPSEAAQSEVRLPGSGLAYRIEGQEVLPNKALRDAMDLPERMLLADLEPLLEKASLAWALDGKAKLPGQEVSINDGLVKATAGSARLAEWEVMERDLDAQGVEIVRLQKPGTNEFMVMPEAQWNAQAESKMRRVVGDQVQESPVSIEPDWKPAEAVPVRGRDALEPEQQAAVESLQGVLMNRGDLPVADRALLTKAVEVLDTVAARTDPSVQETLEVLPAIVEQMAKGTPEEAAAGVRTLAESLTVKAPEQALRDMARLKAERGEQVRRLEQAVQEHGEASPEAGIIRQEIRELNREAQELRRAQEGGVPPGAAFGGFPLPKELMPLVEAINAAIRRGEAWAIKKAKELLARFPELKPFEGYLLGQDKDRPVGLEATIGQLEQRETVGVARVAEVAVEAAKTVAGGVAEIGAKWWNWVFQHHAGRVRAVGEGQVADDILLPVRTKQKMLVRQRIEPAGLYELHGLKRSEGIDALAHDIVTLPGDADAGVARFALLGDSHLQSHWGKIEPRHEGEAKVMDLTNGVFHETGRISEETGVVMDNGQEFRQSDLRARTVKLHTQVGQSASALRTGPLWEARINWLQENYGWERPEAERRASLEMSLDRRDATEITRKIPFEPTHYRINGRWEAYFETDPVRYAESLAWSNSHVMAALSVMPREAMQDVPDVPYAKDPQQPDLPKSARALLNAVNTRNKAATKTVARALRVAFGMLPEGRESFAQPGTRAYHVERFLRGLINVDKAAKLTRAHESNVFEPLTNASFLGGVAKVLESEAKIIKAAATGQIKELHRQMVEEGWMADSRENNPWRGDNPIETWENSLRKAGEKITFLLRGSQAGNEMIHVDRLRDRLAEMRDGRGDAGDVALIRAIGLSEARAQAMIEGRGTKEDYDHYIANAVGTLAGGRSAHGLEKSEAATSRPFNALVWFTNLFQFRTRVTQSLASQIIEAPADQRVEKTQQLLKYAGFTVAGGALMTTLQQLISRGWTGPADWVRENTAGEDEYEVGWAMLKLTGGLFGRGTGGGLFQPVATAAGQVGMGGTPASLVTELARTAGGIGAAIGFTEVAAALVGAEIPGYEGKSPLQIIAAYVRNETPALRLVHNGIFGLQWAAITEENRKLDAGLDSLTRFLRKEGKIGTTRGAPEENTRAFRTAMRKVIENLRSDRTWSDQELIDAFIDAQDAWIGEKAQALDPRGATIQGAREAVAAALLARRVLPQPADRSWTDAEHKALRRHLGEEHLAELEAYNLMLEQMSKRVRYVNLRR